MPHPAGNKRLGQLDGLTMPSLFSIGVAIGVSLWAWFTFVLASDQDFAVFTAIVAVTHAANGLAQLLIALHPRTPELRWQGYRVASFVPGFGAMVLTLVGWLIAAPPALPVDDFGSGDTVYQVIGVLAIVLVGATITGAGLGGLLVVLPVRLISRAVRGDKPAPQNTEALAELGGLTRRQQWTGGAIILATVCFALSMHFVYPDAPGRRYVRIRAQFEALLTLTGEPAAVIAAYVLLAAIIALVVIHNRPKQTPS